MTYHLLMFCGQVIKVDTYGFGAESSTENFEYHVNAQFDKMSQLAMEGQRERDGGMISQKNMEGVKIVDSR